MYLIEHRWALCDAVKAKLAAELVYSEDLLLSSIVPAQQGQEVDHGRGQEALVLELAHRGSTVPGGEEKGRMVAFMICPRLLASTRDRSEELCQTYSPCD